MLRFFAKRRCRLRSAGSSAPVLGVPGWLSALAPVSSQLLLPSALHRARSELNLYSFWLYSVKVSCLLERRLPREPAQLSAPVVTATGGLNGTGASSGLFTGAAVPAVQRVFIA